MARLVAKAEKAATGWLRAVLRLVLNMAAMVSTRRKPVGREAAHAGWAGQAESEMLPPLAVPPAMAAGAQAASPRVLARGAVPVLAAMEAWVLWQLEGAPSEGAAVAIAPLVVGAAA